MERATVAAPKFGDSNSTHSDEQAAPCVLLTGGTGFVGKALLPLLLDSHPEATVVLLIRGKRNKTTEERRRALVHELFYSSDASPESYKKIDGRVRAVEGDVMDPTFYDNEAMQSLGNELTHIINSAASVRRIEFPTSYMHT
jgi:thioester reductase-like protein